MSIVPYVDRRLEYFTPKGRKEDRKMYAEINMEGRVVNDPEFYVDIWDGTNKPKIRNYHPIHD